jgi:hypothetical protein
MRLAHARPAAVALVAGGVLVAAASGIGVAVAATAAAATGTVTAGTGESCEAVALPAPQPSSSPTQTTTWAPSAAPTTPYPTSTPTASPSWTPSWSGTGTQEPTDTVSPTSTASPTATPTATPTASATGTGSPAAPVSLCVKVVRAQASSVRGHAAQWTVTAWTTGGSLSAATLKLQAVPASVAPRFSSGCGRDDGTSSCNLGATDAKSAQHKFQVKLTVPVTAATVRSVSLTVIGSTTGSTAPLPKALKASSAVSITAPSAAKAKTQTKTKTKTTPTATSSPGDTGTSGDTGTIISALPVGNLPGIPLASSAVSPGGNAAGLFPTLSPSPSAPASATPAATKQAATEQAAAKQAATKEAAARQVANTSALPEGASVVGVQLAGLSALAVAIAAAVTRFAVRRHPALTHRFPGTKAKASSAEQAAEPSDTAATAPADSQDTRGGARAPMTSRQPKTNQLTGGPVPATSPGAPGSAGPCPSWRRASRWSSSATPRSRTYRCRTTRTWTRSAR